MAQYSSISAEIRARNAEVARLCAKLTDSEVRWHDKQPFLEARGYMLRPRYRPGWRPSWEGTNAFAFSCEDGIELPFRPNLIDATRVSDGHLVYIKRVETGDDESDIACMFSQETLRNDPDNHCVPILDVFQDDEDPTMSYMVMPFLRLMDDPPFEFVHDVIDFADQLLEGLVYMHEHGVAHHDCAPKNLMMDAFSLYPHGFHPVRSHALPDLSRRAKPIPRILAPAPVKYYYVDFGISVRIPPEVYPKLVLGLDGQDRDVPELSVDVLYDPFKVDIFILGNVFRQQVYAKFSNVGFMHALVQAMTHEDPAHRPDAIAAIRQWRKIRGSIFLLHRGWRLRQRSESPAKAVVLDVVAFLRLGLLLSARFLVWTSRLLTLQRRLL